MHTRILAVVYVVLAAVLLLASALVVRADGQPERDFYQCVQPEGLVPPIDGLKTCMLQMGHSDEETTGGIQSLPDQELSAPSTGDLGRGGNGGEDDGMGGVSRD